MFRYLKGKGYTDIRATDKYILAGGELPVCLCAHMDTVFSQPPRTFYYDNQQQVLWSPNGMGADDRAGIYAIIMLLEKGYKPWIVLTDLEEKGGQGADALTLDYVDCPIPDCKALIQLDRQGMDECVFYECANQDFTELIESYGFQTDIGTFTDISILGPVWEVAAVNLSVGYINEHTYTEHLHCDWLESTIAKVEKMLADCGDWQSYAYIAAERQSIYNMLGPSEYDSQPWWFTNNCCYCGKHLDETEGKIISSDPGHPEDCMLLCDDCFEQYKKYLAQDPT